jgi:asparagine synthase (glutamine-hydrolysing)
MCGFAGILRLSGRDDISSELAGMSASLAPRGPDASGAYLSESIGLVHRRLSIIDVTGAGAQPMTLAHAGITIAYNGEVYNFRELRSRLESLGHRFIGRSDTEVILHAYWAWGLEGLKRLEGIFGLSIWDENIRRLVLMRDRLGVKPVYYGASRHGLAFGSEIKSVLLAGGVDQTLDEQAFREYLWFGNSFGDRTFYRGVRALEPGHWLIADDQNIRVERWWSVETWAEAAPVDSNFADGTTALRCAIDRAVGRQLVSDVPVGLFLSGGLDSSAVASSASRLGGSPVRSYAAGFDFEKGVNELPKAAAVARHLGLNHSELIVRGSDVPEAIVRLARAHDEPFADAANIPLYLMCKALGGDVKVVLQGDGGDELFAGYRRYVILRHISSWRAVPSALRHAARWLGRPGERFARLADAVCQQDPGVRMALLLTTEIPASPPERVCTRQWRENLKVQTDPFLVYRTAAQRFRGYDPVRQMLLTDLTVQLPSQFLTKVDRATSANGVEARVPLLDELVAEFALRIPATWKVKGLSKKRILKEALRERLPSQIIDAPKTGFGVPYQHWLRTSLFEFSRERILESGFLRKFHLDGACLEAMLESHRSGIQDNGFLLWKVLNLQLWADSCLAEKLAPPAR